MEDKWCKRPFSLVICIFIANCFVLCLGMPNEQQQEHEQENPENHFGQIPSLKSTLRRDTVPCGAIKQMEVNDALVIESPHYGENRNYPNGLDCRWRFLFPRCALTISCPNFRLSDFLCSDYMEITDDAGRITRFCGNQGPSNLTLSKSAEVSFRTSLFFNSVGFRCQVLCIDDGSASDQPDPVIVAPKVDCACGQAVLATKIVNGEETQIGEFPWMASLVRTGSKIPFCGASIINSRYILTAAHCVTGRTPFNTEVLLNDHNTAIETETELMRRKVEYIIAHRSYTSRLDNDVALIKLREPIDFVGSTIVPVCLPENYTENYVGETATVVGWGLTSENSAELSDVLLKTDVDVITNQQCSQAYPNVVTQRMLCAYRDERDACQGDSGGPLLLSATSEYVGTWGYSEAWNESDESIRDPGFFKYTQIGIVSWGQGCARRNKPGVYARITEFMPWILRATADGSYCSS